MKRILFLLVAVGLSASITATAGMNVNKVRKETRFLTDKMAYELNLSTQQYNDVYEINFDFVYSLRDIMDYVSRGNEWAMDDYYEALDIRNDDLRWVLSESQYRRFMGADYFYRPIYVTGGKWNFRIYINYPNHRLFYFGLPPHYHTYCGEHYRPNFHRTSYYFDRYKGMNHFSAPHRGTDRKAYHATYRRSDFGTVTIRPNTSTRPQNAPTRPGTSPRPGSSVRPGTSGRPGSTARPGSSNRPGNSVRPETGHKPSTGNRPSVGERPDKNTRPGKDVRPNKDIRPNGDNSPVNKGEENRTPGRRPSTSSGTSSSSGTSVERPSRGGRTERKSGTTVRPRSSDKQTAPRVSNTQSTSRSSDKQSTSRVSDKQSAPRSSGSNRNGSNASSRTSERSGGSARR